MVVPVSAVEQAMLTAGQCDAAAAVAGDWTQPMAARPTTILDGIMSRSCSALPSHGDTLDEDGLLLPPSPFRSPDFDDPDAGGLDGVLASCGYGRPPTLPAPPPNDDDATAHPGQHAAPNGHRRTRQLNLSDDPAGRGNSGGGNFAWTSLSSPDDVTPTNENQPHSFGGANGRVVASVGSAAQRLGVSSDKLQAAANAVRYSDI